MHLPDRVEQRYCFYLLPNIVDVSPNSEITSEMMQP